MIADHYLSPDLTYAQARDEARQLRVKKQRGVVIVTNEAAKRMISGAAGVTEAPLPDMKHG